MMYIVFGTGAVFLLDMFSTGAAFSTMLSFTPYEIFENFQLWRLVTFVFVPLSSSPFSVILSLYFYYFVGSVLEREWGSTKFTVYYAMGVLLNIVVGLCVSFFAGMALPFPVVSMHYVNLSLFLAFAALYPDMQLMLFFILPVKVKWLAWLDLALFAFDIFQGIRIGIEVGYWGQAILPVVAIFNFLLFFSHRISYMFGRVRHQTSRRTVEFKKATREAKREKGYLHKCSVCGVTDAQEPNMEFRYCSRCEGYHCYCMDHINNHVHIQ